MMLAGSALLTISTAILAGLLAFTCWSLWLKPRKALKFWEMQGIPTQPLTYPASSLIKLIRAKERGQIMQAQVQDARVIGRNRIYAVAYAFEAFLNVSDPDIIKEIMFTHAEKYHKSSHDAKDTFRPLLGNGILMSEDEFWKKQRSLLSTAFHHVSLKAMFNTMTECLGTFEVKLQDKFKAGVDADTGIWRTDIEHGLCISVLTLDIIAKCAFGADLPEVIVQRISELCGEALHQIQERCLNLVGFIPYLNKIRFPSLVKLLNSTDGLTNIALQLMNERRDGLTQSKCEGGDLLDVLLSSVEAKGLSDKEIRDEAVTFIFAAYETTANMLTWAFFALANNESVQEKCRQEAFAVLGDEVPSFDQVKSLKYIEAFCLESLRMYPPFPMIGKYAVRDHYLMEDKLFVPAGTLIGINSYVVHRDERFWPEPEKFDPSRFLLQEDGKPIKRHHYAYLPFSAGARACMGKNFALIEIKLIIAVLLKRFKFSLVPGQNVTPDMQNINMVPQSGVKLDISRIR
eukprot:TRINITY_DN4208_c0_g1_i2.p1 TRINITY_DN4208_c0_g1~~TRINITY_DN4208_c0_g1_i2.p1  ORF type:complete len:516 (+),score=123.00 TRINITY_DN4208_c0_g1_i2:2089-3636(+)